MARKMTETERKASHDKSVKKWKAKNKKKTYLYQKRSRARSFIKNDATLEDLQELEELIQQRKQELNNSSAS